MDGGGIQVHQSSSQLLFAGAVAGGVEALAVQPLDLIATRFQLGGTAASGGLVSALRNTVAQTGVQGLYRGVIPEILCGVPKSAALWATFARVRDALADARGLGSNDWLSNLVAGAASGVPEAFVITPFQVVKVRLQAQGQAGIYRNAAHCLRVMLATEGVRALAAGLGATIARNSVWNSVYFSTFAALRSADPNGERSTLSLGFIAGVFATGFSLPCDVVKSRQQAELTRERPTRGMVAHLRAIVRTDGASALWSGWLPKSLRMGLGGAVAMTAFSTVTASMPR